MLDRLSRLPTHVLWLLFVAVGLGLAFVAGKLSVHYTSDSPSYLNYSFASVDAICRSTRTPGYPLWAGIIRGSIGMWFVPPAQVIVHATAAFWLFAELRIWKLRGGVAMIAAATIGVGCTAMGHVHTVSTDTLAASLGVMTATALLHWARKPVSWKSVLPVVALATTAIFVRPAYLFLIPWLVVAGTLISVISGKSWWKGAITALVLGGAVTALIVVWMAFRFACVGDFGILPFGHQNLAAVLVQLVSDDELRELDPVLGNAIVEEKKAFDKKVGFAKGEPGATMTIDARWDNMTYFVVMPAAKRHFGDDTVTHHRAIADLNKKIMRTYPMRYAKWILLAGRRGAWSVSADIAMHPIFLVCIALMMIGALYRSVVGGFAKTNFDQPSLRALTVIAFTYVILKVGFVVLTSPPIGRFSDAAAIFVPAWIAVVFLTWWQECDDKEALVDP